MKLLGKFDHKDSYSSLEVRNKIHHLFVRSEPWEVQINTIYIFHYDDTFYLYNRLPSDETELWESDDPKLFFHQVLKKTLPKDEYIYQLNRFENNHLRFFLSSKDIY